MENLAKQQSDVPRRFRRNLEARAKPLAKVLRRFLERLARREARRLREAGLLKLPAKPSVPVQKIDDRDADELTRILERQGKTQANDAGKKTAAALGLGAFALSGAKLEEMNQAKRERALAILEITRQRFEDKAAKIIERAELRDERISQRALEMEIVDEVTREGPMSPGRAAGISRTETTQSSNFGVFAAVTAAALAVREKALFEWVAILDDRTRSTHGALNGDRQPAGTAFQSPSGAELLYPGDPAAPIEETINCFPGYAFIEGRVIAASRFGYVGPMLKIATKSGLELPVTPNHPILTPLGFIAAASLTVGDRVLAKTTRTYGSGAASTIRHGRGDAVWIAQIFAALMADLGQNGREVRGDDCRGDGAYGTGDLVVTGGMPAHSPYMLGKSSDFASDVGDVDFSGRLIERSGAYLATDEITSISSIDFSGYVYDAQSPLGWIMANGILASNCRCILVPVTA